MSEMTVAKSGPNNLKGGTFGYTRNNGTRRHNGLDLYAEEGTPVFAMIDGEIWDQVYCIEQPNRRGKTNNYPESYKGTDKNDAGNRIYIVGNTNSGINVRVGYFHLQEGNAVAINPRTGNLFKPGEIINGNLAWEDQELIHPKVINIKCND